MGAPTPEMMMIDVLCAGNHYMMVGDCQGVQVVGVRVRLIRNVLMVGLILWEITNVHSVETNLVESYVV